MLKYLNNIRLKLASGRLYILDRDNGDIRFVYDVSNKEVLIHRDIYDEIFSELRDLINNTDVNIFPCDSEVVENEFKWDLDIYKVVYNGQLLGFISEDYSGYYYIIDSGYLLLNAENENNGEEIASDVGNILGIEIPNIYHRKNVN